MAQNWNVKQAYAAIKSGEKDAIIDIGKRFPLAMAALIKVGESDAIEALFNTFPDHLTMRKIENTLREGVKVDDSDNEVEEEATEAEETTEKPKKAAKPKAEGYAAMTGDQLIALLKEKGVYKDCIKKMGGGKKQQMLDYIEKYGLETAEEETEEAAGSEEETSEYDGMSAMELFKECKKRGIKVKPRQKAAVYVEVLKKADQESGSEEEEEWEEEEPAKEEKKAAPKKPVAKPKAAVKKHEPKKEVEEEDEEDEDWNI